MDNDSTQFSSSLGMRERSNNYNVAVKRIRTPCFPPAPGRALSQVDQTTWPQAQNADVKLCSDVSSARALATESVQVVGVPATEDPPNACQ